MNAIKLHCLLLKARHASFELETIANKKKLRFDYSDGICSVKSMNSKKGYALKYEDFISIHARYKKALSEHRILASYYTDPKWPESPNRVVAPWVMRLIHFYETGC